MKIGLIAFTKDGAELCFKTKVILEGSGHACSAFANGRAVDAGLLDPLETSLTLWAERALFTYDVLIFIGTTGIAVRATAPYLRNKTTDPAVIVIDEGAHYVVPVITGHISGANRLAMEIAERLSASAVITTPGDFTGRFSVDTWAVENNLYICNKEKIRDINGSYIDGEHIGIAGSFPVSGKVPVGVIPCSQEDIEEKREMPRVGVYVSLSGKERPFEKTLAMIPRIVTIGLDCDMETDFAVVKKTVESVLMEYDISVKAVKRISSVDTNRKAAGILKLCKEYKVRYGCFGESELENLEQQSSLYKNAPVKLSGIAERAAFLGSMRGELIVREKEIDSIKIAVAVADWNIIFD